MDNAYKSSLPNSSGPFASETSTPARGYRAEERPRVRPVVRDESVVGIYSEHVNPQPGGSWRIVSASPPCQEAVYRASIRLVASRRPAGTLGPSVLWDQSTPNSHSSTKVYAGALRLHRKDCFRTQNASLILATNKQRSARDRRNRTVGRSYRNERAADCVS
jgi:hypothetical protein